MAYSLLGIFDVNMQLLYGEGDKAFIRLQKAIMEQSNDESIFAWGVGAPFDGNPVAAGSRFCGMLVNSPKAFENSRHVSPISRRGLPSYQTTNEGVLYYYYTTPDFLFAPFAHRNTEALTLELSLACGIRELGSSQPTSTDAIVLRIQRHKETRKWYRVGYHKREIISLQNLLHMLCRSQRHVYVAAEAKGIVVSKGLPDDSSQDLFNPEVTMSFISHISLVCVQLMALVMFGPSPTLGSSRASFVDKDSTLLALMFLYMAVSAPPGFHATIVAILIVVGQNLLGEDTTGHLLFACVTRVYLFGVSV
jgi:hypothetical protein